VVELHGQRSALAGSNGSSGGGPPTTHTAVHPDGCHTDRQAARREGVPCTLTTGAAGRATDGGEGGGLGGKIRGMTDEEMFSAVDMVSEKLAGAFATTWASEQGRQIMDAFLHGQARFIIENHKFTVVPVNPDEVPDETEPLIGQYL
jgi:hypothetical protein